LALADARELIVHATTRSSNGTVTETWEDDRKDSRLLETRLHGRLVTAMLLEHMSGPARITVASHRQRAWTAIADRLPRFPTYASEPAELREELQRPQIALLGLEKLRGRDALLLTNLLQGTTTPSDPVHVGPTRVNVWVDPVTYLPLRRETRGS